jgi:hypothetical protein
MPPAVVCWQFGSSAMFCAPTSLEPRQSAGSADAVALSCILHVCAIPHRHTPTVGFGEPQVACGCPGRGPIGRLKKNESRLGPAYSRVHDSSRSIGGVRPRAASQWLQRSVGGVTMRPCQLRHSDESFGPVVSWLCAHRQDMVLLKTMGSVPKQGRWFNQECTGRPFFTPLSFRAQDHCLRCERFGR